MMPGCIIHIWLFFFAVFARGNEVEVKTGLYSRVEFTGEKLADFVSVEWNKHIRSDSCLCFKGNTTFNTNYSKCCGTFHFSFNNNSFILENVTEEAVFTETVVLPSGTMKRQNFTLIIQYPPNVTEIVVSWTSNTSVTLKCEVSGSFLNLTWKREAVPILEKHRHSFSEKYQTLHISDITSSDYGTYSCIASNAYGQSEKHTYITGENSTVNQGNDTKGENQFGQIVLTSGLTLTCVLGLCIVFCCLYTYHHRQNAEKGRTTSEGAADDNFAIYQDVPDTGEVTPLPYVYTDFIKPRDSSQSSAAAQHLEDFGYSEVGPASKETVLVGKSVSNEQSTACPNAGEE